MVIESSYTMAWFAKNGYKGLAGVIGLEIWRENKIISLCDGKIDIGRSPDDISW